MDLKIPLSIICPVSSKTTRKLNTHYIQPGVVVGMPLGIAIIGVEARYTRLEKGYSMPAIYGLVGFKFGL